MADLTCDVLVVGAGPTGLMLANWLVKLGVDAILVDGKDGPTRESRALVVQARSLEIYDQLGIGDGLVRLSVGIEHADDLIADLDQAMAAARR